MKKSGKIQNKRISRFFIFRLCSMCGLYSAWQGKLHQCIFVRTDGFSSKAGHGDGAPVRAAGASEDPAGGPQPADHYRYYTNQIWGMAANYHLCIDTSLGYDVVNDMIQKAIKAGGFASAQGQERFQRPWAGCFAGTYDRLCSLAGSVFCMAG